MVLAAIQIFGVLFVVIIDGLPRSVDGDEDQADYDKDECECHYWTEHVCTQDSDPPHIDEIVVFYRCRDEAFSAGGDGVVGL